MAAAAVLIALGCSEQQKLESGEGGSGGGAGQGGNTGRGGTGGTTLPGAGLCRGEVLPGTAWRKLTTQQYTNTLRDLFQWAMGVEGEKLMHAFASRLDSYPRDERLLRDPEGGQDRWPGYRRENLVTRIEHVEEGFELAFQLGLAVSEPERMRQLVGDCVQTASEAGAVADCVRGFVSRFAGRAFRRPLSAEDLAELTSIHPAGNKVDSAAIAEIVTVILASPEFLYHVEHGEGVPFPDTQIYGLSIFELAARLSYHFWDTLPDDALWNAAADGSLANRATYEAQIERLLADPRARNSLGDFFEDYLGLEDVPRLDRNDREYKTFAGSDLPGPQLRDRIIDEAREMALYSTYHGENIDTLMRANRSFARTPDLAAIYRAPIWTGESEPPKMPNERPGIFSHAWFLVSGMTKSRPLHRAYRLRRSYLCSVYPPPDIFPVQGPIARMGVTERTAIEEMTREPRCRACHEPFLNDLGFALESYDGLGRHRTEEMLWDNGNLVGTAPVNTRAVPQIRVEDKTTVEGPTELVEQMIESRMLERCLADHVLTFTFGRSPPTAEVLVNAQGAPPDYESPSPIEIESMTCSIDTLAERAKNGTLLEMFAASAQLDAFRRRDFSPAKEGRP